MEQDSELIRLEGFVTKLLAEYSDLKTVKVGLDEKVEQQKNAIAELEQALSEKNTERNHIDTRVTGLIGKIEEWESALGVQVDDGQEDDNFDNQDDGEDTSVQGNLFAVDSTSRND